MVNLVETVQPAVVMGCSVYNIEQQILHSHAEEQLHNHLVEARNWAGHAHLNVVTVQVQHRWADQADVNEVEEDGTITLSHPLLAVPPRQVILLLLIEYLDDLILRKQVIPVDGVIHQQIQ